MPLTEINESDGWRAGDIVTIQGERSTEYVIKRIVLNPRTQSKWADLWGGYKGRGPQLRGKSLSYRAVSLDKLKRK
jgi:hypothetical protein